MLDPISPTPDSDTGLPYSPAILARGGRTLYISGQIGIDAAGVVAPEFEAQVRQAWHNLEAVLAAAGMDLSNLAKVTAYLTDAADYPAFGKLRLELLRGNRPASTLVVAAALARPEWRFEVEAIAVGD